MPDSGSVFSSASALNCGLWRERGTVRTSARHSMPCARRMPSRASSVRLECPTVYTVTGMAPFRIPQPENRWRAQTTKGDKDGVLIPLAPPRPDRAPAPRATGRRLDLVLRRLPGRSLALRRGVLCRLARLALRRGGALILRRRGLVLRRGLRRRRGGRRGGLLLRRLARARDREQHEHDRRAGGHELREGVCHGLVHLSP